MVAPGGGVGQYAALRCALWFFDRSRGRACGLWPMMRPGAVSGATHALRCLWHEVRVVSVSCACVRRAIWAALATLVDLLTASKPQIARPLTDDAVNQRKGARSVRGGGGARAGRRPRRAHVQKDEEEEEHDAHGQTYSG
eukprot:18894-Prymnesium_polylepis.1